MRSLPLLGLLYAIAACTLNEQAEPGSAPSSEDDSLPSDSAPTSTPSNAAHAHAELQPTGRSGVDGTVDFIRLGNGIRVVAIARGLDDGRFGFHIHEGHSCGRHGGHFNPEGALHDGPESVDGQRHAGDLGNIRSELGRARYDRIDTVLRMDSTDSIIGSVIAIHTGQDDLNTQPSGGSGDIAACGIIEAR